MKGQHSIFSPFPLLSLPLKETNMYNINSEFASETHVLYSYGYMPSLLYPKATSPYSNNHAFHQLYLKHLSPAHIDQQIPRTHGLFLCWHVFQLLYPKHLLPTCTVFLTLVSEAHVP